MMNKNYYTITIALLGALKLILDSFGIKLITNQNTNDIANAIATFLTVAGVFMSHIKNHPKFSFKQFVSKIVAKFKKKPAASVAEVENVVKQVEPVVKTVESTIAEIKTTASAEQPKEDPAASPTTNTVQK